MQFIDLNSQQKRIRNKINMRIKNVLDHGKYVMGPEVYELEKKLADYIGVKYCISCSSGTDALLIPLLAKGIGYGDAVITTPFTYVATAEVISLLGAKPIFLDIYPETFNLDINGIQHAIDLAQNKGLNPKAIIAVDLFGTPARYRLIEKVAKDNGLVLLEDFAQGFGGSIRGEKAGTFGDVAATSFFPAKPLGCYGDGGAIFTNDGELAEIMKSIRVHGSGKDKYDNVRIGINGRLDTIQAAVLLEKLTIFDDEIILRNNVADYYTKNISSILKKPYIPEGYLSCWAQYCLLANSKRDRIRVLNKLKKSKIPSMIYYRKPLHLQKSFSYLKYKKGDFPISEKISGTIFSIPMHPYLTKSQQDQIIETINNG